MVFSQQTRSSVSAWVGTAVLTTVLAASVTGCSSMSHTSDTKPEASAVKPDAAPATVQPATDQTTFDTPDAAVAGLLAAVQSNDRSDLRKIFGTHANDLTSGDPVEDANDYQEFARRTLEKAQLEEKGSNVDILHIGNEDWPFPIPISKAATGRWYFDTAAGQNEILARRVGANELETISMCRAYVEAQREYASQDRDDNGVLQYAQSFRSHPGKKDGLYWDAKGDEPQSPFGPLFAQAAIDGYGKQPAGTGPHPFHGYYYHILNKQGPAAPGGAYNYVINGNMIAGFALISYPDEYGKSGVMTFIVSHQGKVYQKDLGPKTLAAARAITAYNPDSSWTLVK